MTRSAGLTVLAALLVVLALALVAGGCGEASGAATETTAELVAASAPATQERPSREPLDALAPAPPPARSDPRLAPAHRAWDDELRQLRAHWIEAARSASGGDARQGNVHVGLHVVDVETGLVLADLDAAVPRRPASNLKLVTTAAALVLFGPAAEFQTPFEAGGPLEDGRLRGDLVVRASGDPVVREDRDPAVEGRLERVARELREAGVQVVEGDLVLDEGTFQTPAPGPAWPSPSQHWEEYCALAGGFSVHGGVMTALVTPTRPGASPRVELHPAPSGYAAADRRFELETVASGRLTLGGHARGGELLVRGTIPRSAQPYLLEFSHEDPVGHFGAVLLAALERQGVAVQGDVRRARNVPGGERLATLRSSVAETLFPINAHSANGVADQLFLALGHATGQGGTRRGGQAATRIALERLGVPVEGLRQVDGSGLSFDNQIAPAQITALLAAVLRMGPEARERYVSSLAVAGEVGTLSTRMRKGPARGRVLGKTGWIRGTSGLSGLVRTEEGRELVFSVLTHYPEHIAGLNSSVFKPMQDELAEFLVTKPFPVASTEGR